MDNTHIPTLEEAALNIIPDRSTAGWIDSFGATERIGFIKGAKWKAEKMYSEEDMLEFALFYYIHQGEATKYWGKNLFKEWKRANK